MTVIVCVDDRNGMMFNNRRQSQDRVLRARILQATAGCTLWISNYSANQFDITDAITIDDAYADKAANEDFCFVEDGVIPLADADCLILYRWNRHYPADRFFEFEPTANGFVLTATTDFTGSSHDTITEVVYKR